MLRDSTSSSVGIVFFTRPLPRNVEFHNTLVCVFCVSAWRIVNQCESHLKSYFSTTQVFETWRHAHKNFHKRFSSNGTECLK